MSEEIQICLFTSIIDFVVKLSYNVIYLSLANDLANKLYFFINLYINHKMLSTIYCKNSVLLYIQYLC